YFKSDWEFPFYNYEEWYKFTKTTKFDFHKPNSEIQTIGIMSQYQRVKYYEDSAVKSFEFPFVDRYYSYVIILPKNIWGVRQMEKTLTYKRYLALLSKQKDRNLMVRIVDTKVTSKYCFDSWLNILGVNGVGEDELNQKNIINLYGGKQSRAVETSWNTMNFMTGFPPINAFGESEEKYNASVEEWYAMVKKSKEQAEKSYNVEKNFYPLSPYLYFIVDNRSGAILLMGRYCGREQNENILSE
ncbi:serpin family protein, partial [Cloacibacillus sp.]